MMHGTMNVKILIRIQLLHDLLNVLVKETIAIRAYTQL